MTTMQPPIEDRAASDDIAAGLLAMMWGDWRGGLVVAVAAAAEFGLLSGWLIPRGPVTATQALTAMAVGLVVGAATGRRLALLVAPAVFIAVFELTRMTAVGPTVDALRAGTLLSWMAFLLGRVLHGPVVIVPMVAAGVYVVELASRLGRAGSPGSAGPGGPVLAW